MKKLPPENMEKTDSRALYELKLTSGMALIYGPEGTKAHAQAIEQDKDKSYRMVVNIVGKARQGKTSLRRMLIGESFNENEESTVGIEHELVDTLGTDPNNAKSWFKVDLNKANIEECDIIVGKHVRQRLKSFDQGNKYKAEVKSFLKATFLSYMMMFMYFEMTESSTLSNIPWYSFMLILSMAFSGMILFDTMRDGFGMAVGTMCLVLYTDCFLRWKSYDTFVDLQNRTCLALSIICAFFSFAAIHFIIGVSMGLSMAMGFCFVLSAMKPPRIECGTDNCVFCVKQMHVFAVSALTGIWTIRHPTFMASFGVLTAVGMSVLPMSYIYSLISGYGVGLTHAFSIKIGFDIYVNFVNPFLKKYLNSRRKRRLCCYSVGILPGIFMASVFGWSIPSSNRILYIFCGTFVGAFVEFCHYLLEGKLEAAPKPSIKNATKVLNVTEASLKLVIRDFAGHPLYHSMHHIYMMGHCIFIICFNLVEAKSNFLTSFAEILYWLQAIFVHDRYPSVRAFIVGTHRDHESLSKEDIESISDQITSKLPRQFFNMVVWNKHTDKPLYLVENSSRNETDPDHVFLRQQLLDLADDGTMKPTYPIKYLYFYRVINECRGKGKLIETLDNIEKMCAQQECCLHKAGELEDMLTYFHECGEIIYNTSDNNQNQLVVLDPKALVNIMTSLVRAPPRSEQMAEFMLAWQTLLDIGIASKRLLYDIIKHSQFTSTEVKPSLVIRLLQYLDLVCKLNLGVNGRDAMDEKCYLVIPMLKDTLPYPQNYWSDIPSDTILYIDFGPVVPNFVFTRLVCQCTSECHFDIGTDGRYHLNVSTSKALFTYRDTLNFKIELLDINENTTPSQRLVKISIRGSDQEACFELARHICQKVCNIVERDFRKCRFKIGVICPFDGPHDYCVNEERHIFSLFENNKPESAGSQRHMQLPDSKDLWCRGNLFRFRYGRVIIPAVQIISSGHSSSSLWNANVIDLPPRLFSDICDDLNLYNSLGRDWRLLADELGRTTREIDLLRFRSPRDPCDALLQDWAATAENATVETLVEKLRRIERFDVVKRIEDYINKS